MKYPKVIETNQGNGKTHVLKLINKIFEKPVRSYI